MNQFVQTIIQPHLSLTSHLFEVRWLTLLSFHTKCTNAVLPRVSPLFSMESGSAKLQLSRNSTHNFDFPSRLCSKSPAKLNSHPQIFRLTQACPLALECWQEAKGVMVLILLKEKRVNREANFVWQTFMQLYAHPMRQEWRNIMILHITVVAVLLDG